MENSTILFIALAISILAVVARVIINKQKDGKINWRKMGIIAAAIIVYFSIFMSVNPHRIRLWLDGEATLADAKGKSICGRKAGYDITRVGSLNHLDGNLYYALDIATVEPTGYYRLKDTSERDKLVDREVRETTANTNVIERTTSLFDITRNVGDNEDKYLPIYMATLSQGDSIFVVMESRDANVGLSPVAMMRPTTEKMRTIAQEVGDGIYNEFYFTLFDENDYVRNGFNYIIYRAIAALAGVLLIVGGYLIVACHLRTQNSVEKVIKKVEKKNIIQN